MCRATTHWLVRAMNVGHKHRLSLGGGCHGGSEEFWEGSAGLCETAFGGFLVFLAAAAVEDAVGNCKASAELEKQLVGRTLSMSQNELRF
mmetsp:Transcript_33156/g.75548  ORF Transcript_33156/g.75548 Transcript_33156/m.75548 type:complete len:90 (+) Transcript_33156:212-481(+)